MICLNAVFQFEGLQVATDGSYVTAFGAAGSSALVLLLLDIQHYGTLAAQVFFGLWLAPLGYLAYTSGLFPKALGVVLVAATVSYLADLLAAFLSQRIRECDDGSRAEATGARPSPFQRRFQPSPFVGLP